MDSHDIHVVVNLYWHESVKVKAGETLSNSIVIKRGVEQSCALSSLLLYIYKLEILIDKDVCINGEWIKNVHYVDDAVTDSLIDLQQLLDRVNM